MTQGPPVGGPSKTRISGALGKNVPDQATCMHTTGRSPTTSPIPLPPFANNLAFHLSAVFTRLYEPCSVIYPVLNSHHIFSLIPFAVATGYYFPILLPSARLESLRSTLLPFLFDSQLQNLCCFFSPSGTESSPLNRVTIAQRKQRKW